MIRRLHLKNYRAFEEEDVQLGKVSLFFGPNNSGKSALLSAISLLSQTLDSTDREIPILLSGKYEDLGTYKDMVYDNDVEREVTIGIEIDGIIVPKLAPATSPRKRPQVVRTDMGPGYLEVGLRYRKVRHETVLARTGVWVPPERSLLQTRYGRTTERQKIIELAEETGIKDRTASKVLIMDHYLPSFSFSKGPLSRRRYEYEILLRRFILTIREQLSTLEFVGPFRQSPLRTYLFSGESPSSVGKHGERAIDMLVADYRRRGKRRLGIAQAVSDWLRVAEIAKRIDIETLTDRHFEIRFANFYTGESQNIADIGFGCSQILPILVAGFNLSPGKILIVQQPEIHLHPRAQAELGTFLCGLARRGLQILVETHSEHLLLRLQGHVGAGHLQPDDLTVHYLYGGKGRKNISRLELDERGFFKDKWPEGFFPERLREAKRMSLSFMSRSGGTVNG